MKRLRCLKWSSCKTVDAQRKPQTTRKHKPRDLPCGYYDGDIMFKKRRKPSTPARIAKARLLYDKWRRNDVFEQDTAIINCIVQQKMSVSECANILSVKRYDIETCIRNF